MYFKMNMYKLPMDENDRPRNDANMKHVINNELPSGGGETRAPPIEMADLRLVWRRPSALRINKCTWPVVSACVCKITALSRLLRKPFVDMSFAFSN